MPDFIQVKDANNSTIKLHTIEDSTSTHFNQSIPITVSGAPLFVDLPGNVSITNATLNVSVASGSISATIADNAPVSVRGGILNAVSLGGGSANIGTVSISPSQGAVPVSIVNDVAVSVRAGFIGQVGLVGAVSIGGGTSHIGRVSVFVDQVPFNVSINNTLPIPVSVVRGTVSIAPQILPVHVCNQFTVSVADKVSVAGIVGIQAGTALIGGVSVRQVVSVQPDGATNWPVSIANIATVSINAVNNGIPNADGQSLGGAGQGHLNVRSVGMVFNRNSSTWDRMTGTSVGLAVLPVSIAPQTLIVHVCNQAPGGTGGGDVSVSPTQGSIPVSIAGGSLSIADNAPVSVRGGRVSIADATLAVTQSGTWNTNASVVGRVSVFVDQVPFNVSINNTLPIPVSIVGGAINIADNAPVSVRGGRVSIADGTLAVTQSGTWNIGALTSINSIVRVSLEGSISTTGGTQLVSVAGPVSTQGVQVVGADGSGNARTLKTHTDGSILVHVCNQAPGGTGGGDVSVSPTQGSIPVSIAGGAINIADNAPVSVRGGRVSIADGTLAVTQSGTWNIGALTSINSIVKVSIEGTLPGGSGTAMVSVGGAVTVQAVQIAGTDGTNARVPLLDVSGTQKVGGFTTNPEYVFTRPTDTVAYAVGDLVANSTVAGTVTPMSFPVSRLTGGGGSFMIRRARLITPNDNRTTDRSYRLHIFNIGNGQVSVANGDNGAFSPSLVSVYAGYIDIPMHLSATAGAAGVGVPGGGSEINIQLAASQVSITGLLEARTSITPGSGVIYRVLLEILQD